jgi:hypothetical protein
MELTQVERAQLSAFQSTEGFQLICLIMKNELIKFNTALLNAKKPEDVLIAHNLASAAAKFYEGVLNTIEAEIAIYTGTPKPGDRPFDVTDGVLDLQNYVEEE